MRMTPLWFWYDFATDEQDWRYRWRVKVWGEDAGAQIH
jgi:hypothetical protein